MELIRNGSPKVRDWPKYAGSEKPWGTFNSAALMSSVECQFLYETVRDLGPGNYANLGVFKGGSAACMAWGLKHNNHSGLVYGVDNWCYGEGLFDFASNNIKENGVDGYIKLCSGETNDWAKKLEDIKFNFIFIDADHSYEGAMADFLNWSPLLKENGILAFHDVVTPEVNGVIEDAVLTKYKLIDFVYNIKAFKVLPQIEL